MAYAEYLDNHIKTVQQVFRSILKPCLYDVMDTSTLYRLECNISNHDRDKYSYSIYPAYANHYEDPEHFPKNSHEYRCAWNEHQKHNPHHWQYWVLLCDIEDEKQVALEMDILSVFEMMCDWHAASINHGTGTGYDWYMSQKDNMILHPKTRELIEQYIHLFQ